MNTSLSHRKAASLFRQELITLAFVALISAGAVSGSTQTVLFIGNSFTYYNGGLDVCVEAISKATDDTLYCTRRTEGGWTLEMHYNNSTTTNMINSGQYEKVVLQDYSNGPITSYSRFETSATNLDALVRAQNAQTVMFMTWTYNSQKNGTMTQDLAEAYTTMGQQLGATISPVGLAWARVLNETSFNMYSDDKHPSNYGTYLAACVFYAILTGNSPVGLPSHFGISAADALTLQTIAWETVRNYDGNADPIPSALILSHENFTVELGKSVTVTATIVDQFNRPLETAPSVSWSVTGAENSITDGTLSAGNVEGTFTLTAAADTFETATQFTVVPYAPIDIKVNCGGPETGVWESDTGYAEGGEVYDWGAITPNTTGITDPAPATVYQTVRRDLHSYSFPIPDGTYRVRLHFIDNFHSADRAMDYTIEDSLVLNDFTIADETGGGDDVVVKAFEIVVSDGNGLQIDCDRGSGNDVFEAAIEILRTDGPTANVFSATPMRRGAAAAGPARYFDLRGRTHPGRARMHDTHRIHGMYIERSGSTVRRTLK